MRNIQENIKKQFQKLKSKMPEKRKLVLIVASCIFIISFLSLSYYLLAPKLIGFFNPVKPMDTIKYDIPLEVAEKLGISSNEEPKEIEGNRLIIPSIGVDTRIIEGQTLDVLNHEEGVWRESSINSPLEEGSNTVIAGHRFQYLPPNRTTFYHLDKVKEGEKILVYWEDKPMVYEVYETKVVTPTQTDIRLPIEDQTTLTIYTCTPLGSDAERIVIIAKLI